MDRIDSMKSTLAAAKIERPEEILPRNEYIHLMGDLLVTSLQIGITNVGTLAIWSLSAVDILLCVAIHKAWIKDVFGIPITEFQGWGVYLLLTIVFIIIFSVYTTYGEKRAYQQSRHMIESGLRQTRQSSTWLLAQINDHEELKALAEQMRGDATLSSG